jgi:hypothetical protein
LNYTGNRFKKLEKEYSGYEIMAPVALLYRYCFVHTFDAGKKKQAFILTGKAFMEALIVLVESLSRSSILY